MNINYIDDNLSFNPYSPGFSIYLTIISIRNNRLNCFNPYSPGFSIYLVFKLLGRAPEGVLQSLFTWIFYLFFINSNREIMYKAGFNPYSPGFSIYLVYLLDILIRSISSKLFDT